MAVGRRIENENTQ